MFICEDYLAEQRMNHKLVLTTELIFFLAMLTSELAYKDLCGELGLFSQQLNKQN